MTILLRLVAIVVALLVVQDIRGLFQGGASLVGNTVDRLFGVETAVRIVAYALAIVGGARVGVDQVSYLLREGASPRHIVERQLRRRTTLPLDPERRKRMLAKKTP